MADPITNPATPDAIFGKQAVTEALADHVAVGALQHLITDAKWDRKELTLTVAPENIRAAVQAAKDAGYNFFEDVTAVDWYPPNPASRSPTPSSAWASSNAFASTPVSPATIPHRLDHLHLALRQLLRTRSLRPLRHPLRRSPPPHPHHDADNWNGQPAPQGLPCRGIPLMSNSTLPDLEEAPRQTSYNEAPAGSAPVTDTHRRHPRGASATPKDLIIPGVEDVVESPPRTTTPRLRPRHLADHGPQHGPAAPFDARRPSPRTRSRTARPSSPSPPTSATSTPASKRPPRQSSIPRSPRSPIASTTSVR